MIDNRYMSVRETAQYMGIGMNKAYTLCKKPDFPTIRVGTKILVDKHALDSVWIQNKQKTMLKGRNIRK